MEKNSNFLKLIAKNPYYSCFCKHEKLIIVYEDHRFIVPILWLAKKINLITTPINLVYFDRHNDALDLSKDKIESLKKLCDFNEVFEFVKTQLKQLDDDWLRTLMHLGIVDNALVIGDIDCENFNNEAVQKWNDLEGKMHLLRGINSLEVAFNFQGSLSDLAKDYLLKPIWSILGWEHNRESGFVMQDTPILIDFDLDYFTFEWRNRSYAWRKDFYSNEFDNISTYFSTKDWSGGKFLNNLIKRAPFITIAKEPKCCGGLDESNDILSKITNKLFSG